MRVYIFCFAAFLAAGLAACGSAKQKVGIKRDQAKNPNSLRNKVKKAQSERSPRMQELLRKSEGVDCPDLKVIGSELFENNSTYTLYISDLDVGRVTPVTAGNGICNVFRSIPDQTVRGRHAFHYMSPYARVVSSKGLAISNAAPFFKIDNRESCNSVTYSGFTPADGGRYETQCKGPYAITVVRRRDGKAMDIREYVMGTESITVTAYTAGKSAVSCDDPKEQDVYSKITYVIYLGTADRARLSRSFAELVDKYVGPRQAEISEAIAAARGSLDEKPADPKEKKDKDDPKRKLSRDMIDIGFTKLEAVVDATRNGSVEVSCPEK